MQTITCVTQVIEDAVFPTFGGKLNNVRKQPFVSFTAFQYNINDIFCMASTLSQGDLSYSCSHRTSI